MGLFSNADNAWLGGVFQSGLDVGSGSHPGLFSHVGAGGQLADGFAVSAHAMLAGQAQIHPHFLYNTLYDIQQLCAMDDTATAAEMVEKLALFYRIGVSRGKKRIPLREELRHVESYLSIQHLRYPEVFEYEIDVSPELLKETVLKLTLQPLVENALYHGVKLRAEPGGRIVISARTDGSVLLLTVSDNGVGIPQEKLNALRAELDEAVFSDTVSHSYGLRNVHNRLRLRWGDGYGLTLESIEDGGCTVTARLPLLSERNGFISWIS